MLRVIRSWPFTLFGLLTISLFVVAVALHRTGADGPGVEVLDAVVQLIIIPLWLMRYVVVAVGGVLFSFADGFPVWYDVLTIPILVLPYIAADLALIRVWRRPRPGNAHAV